MCQYLSLFLLYSATCLAYLAVNRSNNTGLNEPAVILPYCSAFCFDVKHFLKIFYIKLFLEWPLLLYLYVCA
jgi:hypothetical protein